MLSPLRHPCFPKLGGLLTYPKTENDTYGANSITEEGKRLLVKVLKTGLIRITLSGLFFHFVNGFAPFDWISTTRSSPFSCLKRYPSTLIKKALRGWTQGGHRGRRGGCSHGCHQITLQYAPRLEEISRLLLV